jgi:hypothetical protein
MAGRAARIGTSVCGGARVVTGESNPSTSARIFELLSRLSVHAARLIRGEYRLARREFQEWARRVGVGAVGMVFGDRRHR